MKKKQELLDSIFHRDKTKDINELNVRFETAQKEYQIASLQAQKRAGQLLLALAVLGVLVFFGAAAFLFYRLRQKQKFYENEKQLQAARGLAQQKEVEKREMELDFNRRELEEFAAGLSEKNRLVETLRQNLEALDQELAKFTSTEKTAPLLEAIKNMPILTGENWAAFRVKFDRVFPGFMAGIRTKHPDLTDAELRFAVMLRMDIRPREMATMLGVSIETIRKTRYRLRKKLGIDENDSLEAFIMNE